MIKLAFFGLLLCSFFSCKEDINKESIEDNTVMSYVFPNDWMGTWEGELNIYRDGEIKMNIPMKLIHEQIDDLDSVKWAIVYGEDEEKGLRDYVLIKDSTKNNHYVIDELNSILLDGYVHDNNFISIFEVSGNQLITKYTRNEEALIFEIFMYPSKPKTVTGGGINAGDTIPDVKTFEVPTYQKAVLRKIG